MSQIFGQKKKEKRFNHRTAKVKFINNDVLKGEPFLVHINDKSLHYSFSWVDLLWILKFSSDWGQILFLNLCCLKGNIHGLSLESVPCSMIMFETDSSKTSIDFSSLPYSWLLGMLYKQICSSHMKILEGENWESRFQFLDDKLQGRKQKSIENSSTAWL